MDKPKCAGCGEVAMETEYWWHEKNKQIWHSSCAVRAGMWMAVAGKSKEETDTIFINACLKNNSVLLDHLKNRRIKELDGFYKKVVSKRDISKELFDKVVVSLQDVHS